MYFRKHLLQCITVQKFIDAIARKTMKNILIGIILVAVCLVGTTLADQCNCDELYDVEFAYGQDAEAPASMLTNPAPLADGRDTDEYRTRAFDFFASQFGIDVDPSAGTVQIVPGPVFTQGFRLDDSINYAVKFISIQKDNCTGNACDVNNNGPATNSRMVDDGYRIVFLADQTVYGAYGGEDGTVVAANDMAVFGEYRMMIDEELFTTIVYHSDCPLTIKNGGLTISCTLEHPDWGTGVVYGTALFGASSVDPANNIHINIRNTATFPKSLTDLEPGRSCKCKNF